MTLTNIVRSGCVVCWIACSTANVGKSIQVHAPSGGVTLRGKTVMVVNPWLKASAHATKRQTLWRNCSLFFPNNHLNTKWIWLFSFDWSNIWIHSSERVEPFSLVHAGSMNGLFAAVPLNLGQVLTQQTIMSTVGLEETHTLKNERQSSNTLRKSCSQILGD